MRAQHEEGRSPRKSTSVAYSMSIAVLLLIPVVLGALPVAGATTVPTLTVTPAQGPEATPISIKGTGFKAGAAIKLDWITEEGSRVNPNGWDEVLRPITTATAGTDGSISATWKTPGDLGGPHRIQASDSGQIVANTTFTATRLHFLTPGSGPAGTIIQVTILGMGWTEYDNVVGITYDNAYVGYACGFYSQGNGTFWLQATGAVGPHIIGIYPAMWNGPSGFKDGPTPWRLPMLNVADAPVRFDPVFLTFTITSSGSSDRSATVATGLKEVLGEDSPAIPQVPATVTADGTPRLGVGNAAKTFVGMDLPYALAGFPPSSTVKLQWSSLTAKATTKADLFKGWPTTPTTIDSVSVQVQGDGKASGSIRITDDHAGKHVLEAVVGGQVKANATFMIIPRFTATLSADGTKVLLHATGLGAEKYGSLFPVLYDGRLTGFVSALTSKGKSDVEIPVVGVPGLHTVEVFSGANGFPYLTMLGSVFAWIPTHRFSFVIPGPETPVVTMTGPVVGSKVEGVVHLTGTASEGTTLVQVKVGDGKWTDATGTTSWSYDWDTKATTDGPTSVRVRATNDAAASEEMVGAFAVANKELAVPGGGLSGASSIWLLILIVVAIIAAGGGYSAGRGSRRTTSSGKAIPSRDLHPSGSKKRSSGPKNGRGA